MVALWLRIWLVRDDDDDEEDEDDEDHYHNRRSDHKRGASHILRVRLTETPNAHDIDCS